MSRWCGRGRRLLGGGGMSARLRLHALTAALLLAAHLFKVLSCGETGGAGARVRKRYVGLYTGPYFDPSAPNNITTQLGTHAYLPCKVRQLSNKSVSWIRRRDAHILTVDRFTFIADERFQAFLVEATDTWTLQVKYVQARDAGVYECQVGTEPKMSHFVQLNVVVPKIEIVGESDLYVKAGSTVSLKCVITQALEEPAYIFWYHNDERVLNYDRSLVEIRMERISPDTTFPHYHALEEPAYIFWYHNDERVLNYDRSLVEIRMERISPDTTVGNLIIYNPRREDSGNYSCAPSNLDSASVVLHVLSGEQPAAMQHGNSGSAPAPRPPALVAALAAHAAVGGALPAAVTAVAGAARVLPAAATRVLGALRPAALLRPPRLASLATAIALALLFPVMCHDEDEAK
ncbi:immunoglobulin i-set domain-containing protein [Phthorimaea operculella]|nr:immunoglobulin i-set domain-containing protein [Phthorimaea operculella]